MSDRADDAEPVARAAAEDTARAQEIRPHQDVEERNRPEPVDSPELGEEGGGAAAATIGAADEPAAEGAGDGPSERAQEIRPHQDVEERNRPDPVDSPELGAVAAGASPARIDAGPDTLDWGPDPDPDAPSPGVASTPAEARPPGVTAAVEPPSPDVALADEASPLPGAHRGGFQRLPTAPVSVTKETAPAEPGTSDAEEPVLMWLMPENPAPHRGLAAWALAFSVAGLLGSIFVGWGFPIGLVGVISAILALRRPLESRTMAVWALVLGVISVLYSAGWLFYAASRANLFG